MTAHDPFTGAALRRPKPLARVPLYVGAAKLEERMGRIHDLPNAFSSEDSQLAYLAISFNFFAGTGLPFMMTSVSLPSKRRF